MHANAGAVTALQQAVAHLGSALETLTNTDMEMLMCSCSYMDAWIILRTPSLKTFLQYRCMVQPPAHTGYFLFIFVMSGID